LRNSLVTEGRGFIVPHSVSEEEMLLFAARPLKCHENGWNDSNRDYGC